MALLRFKQTYLGAGFELDDAELPDHLCVVLEFAATIDRDLGRDLMLDHRAGLELLRLSLRDMRSPWASLHRRGHGHPAAPARRGARRRTPTRSRGSSGGGGRAGSVRQPAVQPGCGHRHRAEPSLLPMPSFPGART